jgi:4-alpha-glucanotransferase
LPTERGAGAIGVNPLHAIFDDHAEDASPYSPNSRLFLNTLYIDVEAAPGFPGIDAAGLREEIDNLRGGEFVNYRGSPARRRKGCAWPMKIFAAGISDEERAFAAFRAQRGDSLHRFAAFEWLRRHLGMPWQKWPGEWRDADAAAIARLRGEESEAIAFSNSSSGSRMSSLRLVASACAAAVSGFISTSRSACRTPVSIPGANAKTVLDAVSVGRAAG